MKYSFLVFYKGQADRNLEKINDEMDRAGNAGYHYAGSDEDFIYMQRDIVL